MPLVNPKILLGVTIHPVHDLVGGTNHEYTSSAGGNIFCPDSFSFRKNLFNSKKSLLVSSVLNSFSQLSCSVPISRANNSLCSSVKVLAHASLLNLTLATGAAAGGGEDVILPSLGAEELSPSVFSLVVVVVTFTAAVVEIAFGAPKNAVIEPLILDFFESESTASTAFRFGGMMMDGRRRRLSRDSLKGFGV